MQNDNLIFLSEGEWELIIDLNGGRIVELKFQDRLVLGTFTRCDGKLANTHVCCPNFANEGADMGLVFHGPGRNRLWRKEQKNDKLLRISCEISQGEEGMGLYKTNLKITQTFLLDKGLKQTIKVKNIGTNEAPVNMAVHNYWSMPEGWNNLKFNGANAANLVNKDVFIDGGINTENQLDIPGLGRVILKQGNLPNARFWTAKNDQLCDTAYACIEPACGKEEYFGSRVSMIKPGEIREYFQSISF